MSREITEIEGLADLVKGLLVDVRCLVHQQIALAKAEVSVEIAKARRAAQSVLVALVVLLLGSIMVPFVLVDLLQYGTSYRLPQWGAGAIVSFVFILGGWILLRNAVRNSTDSYRKTINKTPR